jgi:hypothetical protein
MVRSCLILRRTSLSLFLVLLAITVALIRHQGRRGSQVPVPGVDVSMAKRAQVVFDWSRGACGRFNNPDLPARALRDWKGRVQLYLSSHESRRMIGRSLNHLTIDCHRVLPSSHNKHPWAFNDHEWLASLWTKDGRNLTALVHEELHPFARPTFCPGSPNPPCWNFAVTGARSTDGGTTFVQPGRPTIVAGSSYAYTPAVGPIGYQSPSNIVRGPDEYFYALLPALEYRAQRPGSCLIRTKSPGNLGSWRAWDGSDFTVSLEPARRTGDSYSDHVCSPVAPHQIARMHESLTYNSYLHQYLLVGLTRGIDPAAPREGFYFAVSDDLLTWSARKLLLPVESRQTFRCGDPDPVGYPSLIDPRSRSRTFAATGRHPYLYYTQFHYRDCDQTLDRDLVRVRLTLSK